MMIDARSIKHFEMYSDEGDEAVAAMVDGIVTEIETGALRRHDLEDRIRKGMADVADSYPEVYDTEPAAGIAAAVSAACYVEGWRPVSRWDFLRR